jgi:glutathione S-transferase
VPLKIWGRLNSINVQKAMLCIEELRRPHERIDAGLAFGIVDTPQYRAMNPNGLVPVIEDGGFVLWESNAIIRYLSAKHAAGTLWPADPHERADADRWMDWQTTTLSPAIGPAFMHLVRLPPGKRDAAAVEPSRRAGEDYVAIMDGVLAKHRFIAGEHLTVGDLALGPALHRWLNLPLQRIVRPNVERWYRDIMGRPAAQKILMTPIS